MKYYSEIVNKMFDTPEELKAAEEEKEKELAAEKEKKEARKKEAEEVEALFKEANEAYKRANEALNAFVKKNGSFHMSLTDSNLPTRPSVSSVFDVLFNDDFWKF